MLAQLVQDLVHLEGGRQGLDQNGRPEVPPRNAKLGLRQKKGFVPKPRLEVALHLGQVEVRRRASFEPFPGVVEDEEPEVEEGARDRSAIDRHVSLRQVPASRPDEERRDLIVQAIGLSFGARELEPPADGIDEVDLTQDDVGPGRRQGILEIRHEDRGAGVQGVDHHLPLDRPRDLDPALLQVLRSRRDCPGACAHALRLRQKPGHRASVELPLTLPPPRQKTLAGGLQPAVQRLEKPQSVR